MTVCKPVSLPAHVCVSVSLRVCPSVCSCVSVCMSVVVCHLRLYLCDPHTTYRVNATRCRQHHECAKRQRRKLTMHRRRIRFLSATDHDVYGRLEYPQGWVVVVMAVWEVWVYGGLTTCIQLLPGWSLLIYRTVCVCTRLYIRFCIRSVGYF